jgi:hypothetical protein
MLSRKKEKITLNSHFGKVSFFRSSCKSCMRIDRRREGGKWESSTLARRRRRRRRRRWALDGTGRRK